MTRLEKLIGFPVPQEHRKELNERLNTYENCDRTTLISLKIKSYNGKWRKETGSRETNP